MNKVIFTDEFEKADGVERLMAAKINEEQPHAPPDKERENLRTT
jgi:hypothetical protein